MEFEFDVVDTESGEVVEKFDNQVEAEEEAQRHSENNEVCCHVSDQQGHVVVVFNNGERSQG